MKMSGMMGLMLSVIVFNMASAATNLNDGLVWQLGGDTQVDPSVKLSETTEWISTPGYGKGLEFHGNGCQAAVSDVPNLALKDAATLAMFFRCDEFPKPKSDGKEWAGAMFSCKYDWLMRVYSNGSVFGGMSNATAELKGAFSGNMKLGLHKWHHLAATWSRHEKMFLLYVDGVEVGRRNDSIDNLLPLTGKTFVLGSDPDGCWFTGAVADVRIYNRALSQAQVIQLSAKQDKAFAAEPNFPNLFSFVVEPYSDRPITPTSRIDRELLGKTLNFTATPGEYESASFVLRSARDLEKVTFDISDLTGSNGTIPATSMDLKVVKCWFQGGAAWRNEAPLKTPCIMVPELLLNDYDLVRVDEKAEKNFIRYGTASKGRYVDVSDPKDNNNIFQVKMPVADHPIYDAKTLQPLPLLKDRNQQFFLTLHAPADAVAGVYKGTIKVKSSDRSLAKLNVEIRVLPFKLTEARTYYNPDKIFKASVYFNDILRDSDEKTLQYFYRDAEQYKVELADLVAHGVTHPTSLQLNCNGDFDAKYERLFREHLRLRKEAGLVNRPIYLISNPMVNLPANLPNNAEGLKKLKDRALKVMSWVEEELGHRDVYFYGLDEAKGEDLVAQIPYWKAIQEVGGKVFCAGYKAVTVPPGNFAQVGEVQDLLICAAESDPAEAALWHSKEHDLWCYAYPQSACENPEVYRRNFGMIVYKCNYDGAATFCYYMGFGHPWNDFDSTLQRDINFVYPTADGVVDTVHFAGYREAFDDIRYASTLKLAIRDGLACGNPKGIMIAKEADKFLAERNVYYADLNETRTMIIDYIIRLLPYQKHIATH